MELLVVAVDSACCLHVTPPARVCLHVVSNPYPTEDVSCEFGSSKYYALCGFGGILSCGLTHTAVVPLDLVKCRLQVGMRSQTAAQTVDKEMAPPQAVAAARVLTHFEI